MLGLACSNSLILLLAFPPVLARGFTPFAIDFLRKRFSGFDSIIATFRLASEFIFEIFKAIAIQVAWISYRLQLLHDML
jgi:hypothetical protein